MTIRTLRTLARLLAPWRTIRRLEQRNKALSDALHNLRVMAERKAREAKRGAEELRAERDAAREAVRRLVRWNLEAYDSAIIRGVYLWATRDGMAGPLPPLPAWLVRWEQAEERQAPASASDLEPGL